MGGSWRKAEFILDIFLGKGFYIAIISLLYGFHMVLKTKVKVKQSKNAYTQYLIVPSAVVQDSQYPFQKDEEVEITVIPNEKKIIVKQAGKRDVK